MISTCSKCGLKVNTIAVEGYGKLCHFCSAKIIDNLTNKIVTVKAKLKMFKNKLDILLKVVGN